MENNQKFGALLRELRKKAGMTLRELAEKVDVNFTYLSKIENGALPPPSEKVIRKLAEVLNCDTDELLTLGGIVPTDLAEILKDRQTREKLRADLNKREAKAARGNVLTMPRIKLPLRGLYRLALPVFLVIAIGISLWYASPTQALDITYSTPSSGLLGYTYTFSVTVNILDAEHLPMYRVDVAIYNVDAPTNHTATFANLPLANSGPVTYIPQEGAACGTATVSAVTEAHWGYREGYSGYVNWGGTGYTFNPATSSGYGYVGGGGTTYITYSITWTSPSSWPPGTYQILTTLYTTAQTPGGGTTFTKTSPTFTLSQWVAAPPPTTPTPTPEPGTTDVSDVVSTTGNFTETVIASSVDNLVVLTIDEGVIGLTAEGEPLTEITIAEMTNPPEPPTESNIIGLTYDFGPDGATFEPPITVTFTYDPLDLLEDVNEEDLIIAYYDTATSSWVTLEDIVVDTVNNTITAKISHFTAFAVIAPPAPTPAPTTPAPTTPAPTTPKPTTPKPTTPTPTTPAATTPAATTPATTTPAVTTPATTTPTPTGEGVNWPLVGGIIAAVIIIAVIVWILVARRRG